LLTWFNNTCFNVERNHIKPLFYVCLVLTMLALQLSGCAGSAKKKGAEDEKIEASAKAPAKDLAVDKRLAEAASKVESEARADFEKALAAMKSGENARAEALLRKVSNKHPDLSGPYVNLGLIKFSAGDVDEAEKYFKKALEVNPRSAISYNHLGIILRGKGDFKEAKRNYEMALDIDPNYANAHLNYGILLDLYLGQLESARDHYQKFQDLSGGNDKVVGKWIADIDLRIRKKNK